MAIRFIEAACTMSWEERKAIEEESAVRFVEPRVRLNGDLETGEAQIELTHGEQAAVWYFKEDTLSHVGRVVAIETDHSVRIMSDVWADMTYAIVYEPTRQHTGVESMKTVNFSTMEQGNKGPCGFFRRILIHNSEMSRPGRSLIRAEIDATIEVHELYTAHKLGGLYAAKLREYDRNEEKALAERREVRPQRWVRVVSGRKVPQGTEGLVFWLGESRWGTKVGIALPEADGTLRMEKRTGRHGKTYNSYANVAWTYLKNIKVIDGLKGRIL